MMAREVQISSKSESTCEVMKTVVPSLIELSNQILELQAALSDPAPTRLIEDQERRIVHDGSRNSEPLLHSAGQGATIASYFVSNPIKPMTSRTRAETFEGSSL